MSKLVVMLTVPAFLALASAGCGGNDATDAQSRLCQELSELRQVVASTPPVTSATPLSQARESQQRIADAVRGVEDAARELGEARVDELRGAQEDYSRTVSSLPGDATVGQAADSLAAAAGAVDRARQNLAQVTCPVPATSRRGSTAAGGTA